MPFYKTLCRQCGKEFETDGRQRGYCSIECFYTHKNESQKRSRVQKREVEKLKNFTLQQQSERIAALEDELAERKKNEPIADNGSVEELSARVAELSEALVQQKKKYDTLLAEHIKFQEEVRAQNEASEKESLEPKAKPVSKKKAISQSKESIELQRCERMGISSQDLPCGQRAYCWRDGKCDKNPLDAIPEDVDLKRLD